MPFYVIIGGRNLFAPGFVDSFDSHYVPLLNMALYGLKKAPKAWFKIKLSSTFMTIGFVHSVLNTSFLTCYVHCIS